MVIISSYSVVERVHVCAPRDYFIWFCVFIYDLKLFIAMTISFQKKIGKLNQICDFSAKISCFFCKFAILNLLIKCKLYSVHSSCGMTNLVVYSNEFDGIPSWLTSCLLFSFHSLEISYIIHSYTGRFICFWQLLVTGNLHLSSSINILDTLLYRRWIILNGPKHNRKFAPFPFCSN